MQKRFYIKDLPIDSFNLEDSKHIAPNTHILNLNFENYLLALENHKFKSYIENAKLVIPDGIFVVWLAKFLGQKKDKIIHLKKLAGIDLAKKLLEEKKRVILIGSNQKTIEILQKKFSKQVIFSHHGYFPEEEEKKISKKISKLKPDLILVAMGSPKQEEFIEKHYQDWGNAISMGVGGSFEVWSEEKKRAPEIWINLKFEWLFRILQEPSRIIRLLTKVLKFIELIIRS